jgi:hypothetical protein
VPQSVKRFRNFGKTGTLIVAVLVILVILVGWLIGLANHRSQSIARTQALPTHTPRLPANPIHAQLNDMALTLAHIEQQLSAHRGGQGGVSLQELRPILAALQAKMNRLAAHSDQLIQQQIQRSTAQLSSQLTAMNHTLAQMNPDTTHHRALTSASLPFQVVSIDTIQQSEVVTVRYAHRLVPLDVGDSLAGWRLATARDINQQAQFINAQSDSVSIDLNEIPRNPQETR